jgi:hypothetical protein
MKKAPPASRAVEVPPADKPSDAIVLDARKSRANRIAIDPMQEAMHRSCQKVAPLGFCCSAGEFARIPISRR